MRALLLPLLGPLFAVGLTLGACTAPPPAPSAPPRSSVSMVEECQGLLYQGYNVGALDNPRATFKQFGDLTTVEIAASYRAASPDARSNPVGFRCLFEKGRLFQAGAAAF
jgi:hypothetical protein